MALLDLSQEQGCLLILWVTSGTCGGGTWKGLHSVLTPKNLCTCLFWVSNNSFNMKLRGPASGGLSQGDTEQKLKLKTGVDSRKRQSSLTLQSDQLANETVIKIMQAKIYIFAWIILQFFSIVTLLLTSSKQNVKVWRCVFLNTQQRNVISQRRK